MIPTFNITYFNGLTLKMTHLRPHQIKPYRFSLQHQRRQRNFLNNLGTFNRESQIDKLLKVLIN
jgi:hypothetical protein